MNEQKICPNCQKELELSAKFCNGCGSAQKIEEKQTSQVSDLPPSTVEGKKKAWIPLGLATGFLLSAVLLCSVFLGKEEETPDIPPVSLPVSTETTENSTAELEESAELEELEQILPEDESASPPEPEPILGVNMEGVERKQLYVTQAVASSTYPIWQHISYEANNTLDGSIDTAWVENADGIGVGEWLEHQFGSTEVVQEIQFYNGYGSAYDQNGVSSQVAVSLSGGETFLYDVVGHWNTLILPYALESTSVRITILEAYSSQDQDTCISEMLVFNKSEDVTSQHWDSEQILKSMESYGDVSGLSSQQAQAFAQAIRQEEEIHTSMMSDYLQWLKQEGVEEYFEDVPFTVSLFSAGNGIPGLLVERAGEIEIENASVVQQVYLWDGESTYRYTTGHEQTDFCMFFCSGVLKVDGEYQLSINSARFGIWGDIGTGGLGGAFTLPLQNGREVETLNGTTFEVILSSSAFTSEYENPIELIDWISESKILKDVDFVSFKDNVMNAEYNLETWGYIYYLFVDGKYKGAYWTEYDVETNKNVLVSPDGITEADLPEVIWEMPEYTDEDIATPKIDGLRFASLLDGFASSL